MYRGEGLSRVRELLSDPRNWTNLESALDSEGNSVDATSKDACKWSLFGAIYHCISDYHVRSEVIQAIRQTLPDKYDDSLYGFSYDPITTQADVIVVIVDAEVEYKKSLM